MPNSPHQISLGRTRKGVATEVGGMTGMVCSMYGVPVWRVGLATFTEESHPVGSTFAGWGKGDGNGGHARPATFATHREIHGLVRGKSLIRKEFGNLGLDLRAVTHQWTMDNLEHRANRLQN